MGTWGVHSFDNDDAVEWAAAYREMGLPVAGSTINVALGDLDGGTINADIACRAIAAVEAVAFALGRGSDKAAEVFAGAPEAETDAALGLVTNCDHVIMAITGGSELSQLWKDANWDDYEQWIASLTDLRSRVNGLAEVASSVADETPDVEAAVGPVAVEGDVELEDIRLTIAGISADIEVLRQEMHENFARLAKRLEGGAR